MSSYLALVIGAILGSSFRYFFTLLNFTILGLPAATILVNIIGSAMAGYFLNKFNGALYIFVYIGFFGSFTTLSSFNMELFSLVSDKSFIKALIYFSLNIFISFLFFYLFHMISLRSVSYTHLTLPTR